MEQPNVIKMFLKFGKEEHIRDLFENGTIFMNPVQYFRTFEDSELRGDDYEGASEIINAQNGEFEINSLNYKGKFVALHLKKSYETILGNILSLYCLSTSTIGNPITFKIDKKIREFGSHCLLVKDNVEFLKRIEKALSNLEIEYYHGFVEYYDKNKFNGSVNIFQKPNSYQYQNEFRVFADTQNTKPLIINIGNLQDIAVLYSSKEIIDTLTFTMKQPKVEV